MSLSSPENETGGDRKFGVLNELDQRYLDNVDVMQPKYFQPFVPSTTKAKFRLSVEASGSCIVTTGEETQKYGDKFPTPGILLVGGPKYIERSNFKYTIGVSLNTFLIPNEYLVATGEEDRVDPRIKVEFCENLLFMAPQVWHSAVSQQSPTATHIAMNGICHALRPLPPFTAVVVSVLGEEPCLGRMQSLVGFIDDIYRRQEDSIIKFNNTPVGIDAPFGNLDVVRGDMKVFAEMKTLFKPLNTLEECLRIDGDESPGSSLHVLKSLCAFLLNREDILKIYRPAYENEKIASFESIPQPWNILLFDSVKDRFVFNVDPRCVCQFMEAKFPYYLNIMDDRDMMIISDSWTHLYGPDGQYIIQPPQLFQVL
jgi:hypothetical protein